MIDYLLCFGDMATAQADPVVGDYYRDGAYPFGNP
jgi:hypothetical protein